MIFYAVGVNHKTAPVEVREALHLSPEEISNVLSEISPSLLKEACIISTCNRTELYGVPAEEHINGQNLVDALRRVRPSTKLSDSHFFRTFTCGSVSHLFRVASALESQVLGDIQILGQVKEAYDLSVKAGTAGNILNHLFPAALHTGKRVRSSTSIGIGAVSVSFAAIELARRIYDDLHRKTVLLIGTGETGTLAARSLASKGVARMMLANRTRERAQELADELHGEVVDFDAFAARIAETDILISATAATEYLLTPSHVTAAMKHRQNRPLLIIDISVPRNVDPAVGKLSNVFLKDLDALQGIVDQNLEKRKLEIPKAEQIVTEEVVNFFLWFNTLDAIPTIQQLRNHFEEIRATEFERFKNKLAPDNLETVEMLTRRIINKLLHPTMKNLKEQRFGATGLSEKAELLREIFNLEDAMQKKEHSP